MAEEAYIPLDEPSAAPDFNTMMDEAQKSHGDGNYVVSAQTYAEAIYYAPDDSEAARATRGFASSTERRGLDYFDEARSYAEQAYETHRDLAVAEPNNFEVQRHCAESGRVIGRMLLKRGLALEALSNEVPVELYDDAHRYFIDSSETLHRLREQTGVYDQHLKNLNPYVSITASLLGQRRIARQHAFAAIRAALAAEWPANPTSAHQGAKYVGRAIGVASLHAGNALRMTVAIPGDYSQPSLRRSALVRKLASSSRLV